MEPKEYKSAELAYHVGLRLDQFHNGILDPVPYYKRALQIDPDYSKAYALAKLGKDAAVVKDALSAAGDMTTDYCFPSRISVRSTRRASLPNVSNFRLRSVLRSWRGT